MIQQHFTLEEWQAEAARRFGPDCMQWRFVCPCCGYVASVADWKAAGAQQGEVAFSCVGRRLGADDSKMATGGPCRYTGGGLFKLNPIKVDCEDGTMLSVFAFADATVAA